MWFIFFVSLVIVCLCVLVHYEVLYRISKLNHWLGLPGKYRVMAGVLLSLVAYTIEIWLFGIGYYFLIAEDKANQLIFASGESVTGFFDALYFSFASYTSLGYGDIVPKGPIQFMAGTEALMGLVFIAWTASFLYLKMQKYWEEPTS